MFSKIKKLKFSVVALLVINLVLFLFVIPSFTLSLGDNQVKYPEIDGNLLYPGSTVGNIREGRGLYATYQIRTTPNFEGIELTDEQKEAVYTDSLSRFQNRARVAGLYDVNIFRDNDAIVFEYPKYYQDIQGLTTQLAATAKIDFISQDGASPLELYDYDIVGAVTQTYLPALGNHLVISFKSERLPQITSALSGDITQGYFYMNIDGQQAFFVAKTQYTNDPDTTMRLVPVSQNVNTTKSLSIIKSYFTEKIASEYAFTQAENVTEVPANFPLNNLAVQFIFGAVVVMLVTGAMFWMNKGFLGKRHLLIAVLFVLTTLALLKLSSAVLSIATYVSMIVLISAGVYLVYAYFKGEWYTKNLVRNLFLGLLAIVVILGPLTKNWIIYDFVGVLTAALAALIVSLLINQSLNSRVVKK
jgi:hypothetical protein